MRKKLFNRFCEVQRRALSADANTGEQAESWSVEYSAVPCRLRANVKARVERKQGRLRYRRCAYALYMDWRDIAPGTHRVRIGNGLYSITGTDDMGGEGRLLCLYLETVQ